MRQVPEKPTPAPALLLAAFRALGTDEQEQAFTLIGDERLRRLAGEESEFGQVISSLRRAAEVLGEAPGIEDYKRVRRELEANGEQLQPSSRILRHFDGSWHLAREAISLAETNSARRIEARFAKRRLGKVWRYTDATLRETVARCVTDIGHVPQVAEFEHWRQREIELARARGKELHLPSPTPYRRRWGSWEKALRGFGYSENEITGRLEPCR
jgi:hypothetical protein